MTPADLQGHWRRDWLRAPGMEDQTTRVHWLQAGAVYADVRVPAMRPEVPDKLSDLSDAALLTLLAADGFAGEIEVVSGVCTWHRHISWHGPAERPDAGRLGWAVDGALIETGVHADYAERWLREDQGPAEAQVMAADGWQAFLVTVGTAFVVGVGRPDAPASAPLIAALTDGRRPEGLARHFDQAFALGHWDGSSGVVSLATDPRLEALGVLKRRPGRVMWRGLDFGGAWREVVFEV